MKLNNTKLRQLREKSKISQNELAHHLGLSQATIWEWEQHNTNVKLEHVLNLCKVLNVDLTEFSDNPTILDLESKKQNGTVNETEDSVEIYLLQKELITHLKKQIHLLESEVFRLNKNEGVK